MLKNGIDTEVNNAEEIINSALDVLLHLLNKNKEFFEIYNF